VRQSAQPDERIFNVARVRGAVDLSQSAVIDSVVHAKRINPCD